MLHNGRRNMMEFSKLLNLAFAFTALAGAAQLMDLTFQMSLTMYVVPKIFDVHIYHQMHPFCNALRKSPLPSLYLQINTTLAPVHPNASSRSSMLARLVKPVAIVISAEEHKTIEKASQCGVVPVPCNRKRNRYTKLSGTV